MAEEKLPITVTTMDVDSDESVRDNIAAIQKEHGLIDAMGNENNRIGNRQPYFLQINVHLLSCQSV